MCALLSSNRHLTLDPVLACSCCPAPALPLPLPAVASAALQYYFETIFPRIPKKVEDDIQVELRRRNLPTKGKGNGGCGGADRRGGDDGNRRPASVKASLSVAFGQRAPNRAGTKTWKDDRIKTAAGGGGGREPSKERVREHSREQQPSADEWRGRERGYHGRSSSREQPRDRYSSYDSRDRDRERERERDRGGRDYDSRRGDR